MIFYEKAGDVIGAGCPLYHIDRMIRETGAYFGDGSHILYVNGSFMDDNDPVGRLMHDFRCTSSADMFYPVLAKQVKFFKETEGGKEIMCREIQMFGFLHTYKLLLHPNFFKETALFKCSA